MLELNDRFSLKPFVSSDHALRSARPKVMVVDELYETGGIGVSWIALITEQMFR